MTTSKQLLTTILEKWEEALEYIEHLENEHLEGEALKKASEITSYNKGIVAATKVITESFGDGL